MFRKIIFWGILSLVGTIAVAHTKAGTYISTWLDGRVASLEEEISPDFELASIKKQMKSLNKERNKLLAKLATLRVDSDRLAKEIEKDQLKIDQQEAWLKDKANELKNTNQSEKVVWERKKISINRARERLQLGLNQLKSARSRLQTKQQTFDYLVKSRDTLTEQVNTYQTEMQRLEISFSAMEADIQAMKLEKLCDKKCDEGSKLAELRGSLDQLKRKIAIERTKRELIHEMPGETGDSRKLEDIIQEINSLHSDKSE